MQLMLLLGDASLEHVVESILHQQLCVLVDCISQPYEAVSRLGCSCIRYNMRPSALMGHEHSTYSPLGRMTAFTFYRFNGHFLSGRGLAGFLSVSSSALYETAHTHTHRQTRLYMSTHVSRHLSQYLEDFVEQGFCACMLLLKATSTVRLGDNDSDDSDNDYNERWWWWRWWW